MTQQQLARTFAIERHGDQKYGKDPYIVHLDAVAEIAADYGDEAVVVAYLHDVVEDTSTTLAEIESLFGGFVSGCVALLTDEDGENRRERKVKTHAKMAEVDTDFELALIVKAADRVANLRACVARQNQHKFNMYVAEHEAFTAAVYRSGLCEPLWREMQQLLQPGIVNQSGL